MTLYSKTEVEKLQETIRQCDGDVWLEDATGAKVDMKDELGFITGTAKLIGSNDSDYELYARSREDNQRLIHFFCWQAKACG